MTVSPNLNVGIGNTNPLNKLHISGVNFGSDPIRIDGLQNGINNLVGSLVVDNNGVVKKQTAEIISAVRITGQMAIIPAGTSYINNFPTQITFDNLNEYSQGVFTAKQTGLYKVNYSAQFNRSTSPYNIDIVL